MQLSVYTDGGCSGNPGLGGWAYVIVEDVIIRDRALSPLSLRPVVITEKWGAERNTTNNRMELSAVIAALEALSLFSPAPEQVTVYTDSQYVQKGITQWIRSWKRNNWRTSGKEPVKNRDLWQRLDELSQAVPLVWQWVKGHAGNELNERCDQMTQDAIASIR